LLEFVGDGKDGLLGYACNLQNAPSFSDHDVIQRGRSELEIQSLNEGLEASMRDYNSMCMEFKSERRQFRAIQHEFLALREEYFSLKKASVTSDALITSQRQDIESFTKEFEESVQSEINLEAEIEYLQKTIFN